MLMTCLMRTMRQKGFFRQMDIIPQALSRPSRSPPSVNPASPFLVIPAVPFPFFPQSPPSCHSRSF